MEPNKDLYFVAVKVFLTDKEERLLITKDRFGDWDLPGGRLRDNDFATPLAEVVKRKMTEELGAAVEYSLGEPLVFMRHEREEILADSSRATRRIFAIGYEAKYSGGEIVLGRNHEKYEWVSCADFKPDDYFKGGWLQGVREYLQLVRNNILN